MKKSIKLISDFNLETYYNFLNQKINNKKYKLIKPNFGLFFDSCFEVINSKNKNHIIFLNMNFWIKNYNSDYNPKLWYAAKIPYSQKVFENAANELNKIIHAFEGKNKKLIIVDLDNTLWGGVLGDLGWKKINLGGHNIEGEAFRDFQTIQKSYSKCWCK